VLSWFLFKSRYFKVVLCNVLLDTLAGYGERFNQTNVEQTVLDAMVRDEILTIDKVRKKQYYYYNTSKLGEILMKTMLRESSEFCKQNWASQVHQQVCSTYSVFFCFHHLIFY